MARRKDYPLYRIIKFLVWLFYPKTAVEGAEQLPEEPAVIDEAAAEASAGRKADAREVRRSRLLMLAAVPLFILLICLLCGGIVRLMQ